jgi:hypothetical protein
MNRTWGYRIILAFDLFLCACIWTRQNDVTISAEVGLAMRRFKPPWWARLLNRFLNLIQQDHCGLAIASDIERAQAAIDYLKTRQY